MGSEMSQLTLTAPPITTWQSLAALIDQTCLRADVTELQIRNLCEQAASYGFATVFVNPYWSALAVQVLKGAQVKVGVPVGFPLGSSFTTVKREETLQALRVGAQEIDMVMNIGALKSGDRDRVQLDIEGVVEVARGYGAKVKVIIETGVLTLEEKLLACQLAMVAEADFVKTCTGFSGDAKVEDVVLMRGVVGEKLGVKASGGIRTSEQALAMIAAGATRIGTSEGIAIAMDLGAPAPSNPITQSSY
jgi:deoxyribose-phosphate aldolase